MTKHELHSQIKVAPVIDPQVINDGGGDIDGETVNLQGYRACEFLVAVGAAGDTLNDTNFYNVVLEHADDDGAGSPDTWIPVTDAKLIVGAIPSAANDVQTDGIVLSVRANDAGKNYRFGYLTQDGKKFVRANVESNGTLTTGTPFAISALLEPNLLPPDDQHTG